MNLPSALSFREPLSGHLKPSEIVLFSGGDSLVRRQTGFGKLSAESLGRFAKNHGYSLVFLDELDYDKSLNYKGHSFAPHWHRVFALPALRNKFPDAKYFIWFDDDILVPYPETDILHHYINFMEIDPNWKMMYGNEGGGFVLNSGFFIMKNDYLGFWAYERALNFAVDEVQHIIKEFPHEQGGIIGVREKYNLQNEIRILSHRHNRYNYNTFYRDCRHDHPEMKWQEGDAIVHFTGLGHWSRENQMLEVMYKAQRWRDQAGPYCSYPIDLDDFE